MITAGIGAATSMLTAIVGWPRAIVGYAQRVSINLRKCDVALEYTAGTTKPRVKSMTLCAGDWLLSLVRPSPMGVRGLLGLDFVGWKLRSKNRPEIDVMRVMHWQKPVFWKRAMLQKLCSSSHDIMVVRMLARHAAAS